MKAENIPLSLLSAHFHLMDTSNDNIYRCGEVGEGQGERGGAHTTAPQSADNWGASHLEIKWERKISGKLPAVCRSSM